MKLSIIILLIGILFLCSCSSIEYAQVNASLKGKKVGVYPFDFSAVANKKKQLEKKDTICYCTGKYANDAITPYLMNAGLIVIPLFQDKKATNFDEVLKTADSLKLDYILVGKGVVDISSKLVFLNKLNLKLINRISKESHFALEYHASIISLEKAMKQIGKKVSKKFQ